MITDISPLKSLILFKGSPTFSQNLHSVGHSYTLHKRQLKYLCNKTYYSLQALNHSPLEHSISVCRLSPMCKHYKYQDCLLLVFKPLQY